MVTLLKNSKYSTNCICLLVSDCFYTLLLLSMVCSDMQLKRDASLIFLMKWVILLFNYLRDLNISFSVNTALNPEETESALEATSYFTEDVTTEGNATLLPLPLSLGRSCSINPCAMVVILCKAWSHGGSVLRLPVCLSLLSLLHDGKEVWSLNSSVPISCRTQHALKHSHRLLRRSSVLLPARLPP